MSGSRGWCRPSAKPQLARLQESGLEARGWGRDVDLIDVGTHTHTENTQSINITSKTHTGSKLQRHQHCFQLRTNLFILSSTLFIWAGFLCGQFVWKSSSIYGFSSRSPHFNCQVNITFTLCQVYTFHLHIIDLRHREGKKITEYNLGLTSISLFKNCIFKCIWLTIVFEQIKCLS